MNKRLRMQLCGGSPSENSDCGLHRKRLCRRRRRRRRRRGPGLAGHTASATDEIAGKALTDMTRLASHDEILTTELRGFAARIRAM